MLGDTFLKTSTRLLVSGTSWSPVSYHKNKKLSCCQETRKMLCISWNVGLLLYLSVMLFNAINACNTINTRKSHRRSCWRRQCHLVHCRRCFELQWPQRPCAHEQSLLAGARGGHAGVESAALTAALITTSRCATLQDRNNTPEQPDQDQG